MEVKSELAALRREQEEQWRELEGMKRQVEQGEVRSNGKLYIPVTD